MPRIPNVEAQQNAPGPTGFRPASPDAYGAMEGRALEGLGDAVSQATQVVDDVYQESKAAVAISKAQRALQEYSFGLKHGFVNPDTGQVEPPADPASHATMFQQKADELREATEKDLFGSGKAQRAFSSSYEASVNRELLSVKTDAVQLQAERSRANLEESIQNEANNFVDDHGLGKANIKERTFQSIDAAEMARQITPQEAFNYKQTFIRESAMGSFRKIMNTGRNGPRDALEALKGGAFDELRPDVKEKLEAQAISREYTNGQRAIHAIDYAERKERLQEAIQGKAAAKEGTDLLLSNKLTPQWLDDNRDILPVAEYKALARGLKGEGTISDSRLKDIFVRDIFVGRDITTNLDVAAIDSRQINSSDYLELKRLNSEYANTLKGNPAAKQEAAYIHAMFGGEKSLRIPGEEAAEAKAQRMFFDFVREHPNATPAEIEKARDEAIHRGSIVDMSQSPITLLTPKYLEGGRTALMGDKAGEAIEKARLQLEAHMQELTPGERQREKKAIMQWKKAIELNQNPVKAGEAK